MNSNLNKESELNKELEKYKNENDKLKKEINLLKEENKKLTNNLQKANKIILNTQNQQNKNITNNEIKKLKDEITLKENQINNLKVELQNEKNKNNTKLINYNDMIAVSFISTDQQINKYPMLCAKTDRFAEIEEKLYQEFEEFRETNNTFIVNGKTILRFKKMSENNIKNGDTIQLIKDE